MSIGKFFDIEEGEIKREFDFETEKRAFFQNVDMLRAMSVEESTLYKKWEELNADRLRMFKKKSSIGHYYDWLWQPKDITDVEGTIAEISAFVPKVSRVSSANAEKWVDVRSLIHTMELSQNPGRLMRFFVTDEVTGKLLGIIALSSDVAAIRVRDAYIGWTTDNKFKDGRLNNTAIASTIAATQPLGYNFLGGKLIAALTASKAVRDAWYEEYGNVLAGVSTTSLYGVHSQYNGMPHFKTMGVSTGKILIKPDDVVFSVWSEWLKNEHPDEYVNAMQTKTGQVRTGAKNNVLTYILRHLGAKATEYTHGYQRGVFFAPIYENTVNFLRNEITEEQLQLKERYKTDIDGMMKWWTPKAERRYRKLIEQDNIKPDPLFYYDVIGMEWEEVRAKYLGEVGR